MRAGGLTRGHLTLGAGACHQLGFLDPGASGDHPPVLWIEMRVPFGFGPQSPWGGCYKGLFTSEGEGRGSIRALKLGATWAHSHPQGLGTSRREPVRTALACLAVGKTDFCWSNFPRGHPGHLAPRAAAPSAGRARVFLQLRGSWEWAAASILAGRSLSTLSILSALGLAARTRSGCWVSRGQGGAGPGLVSGVNVPTLGRWGEHGVGQFPVPPQPLGIHPACLCPQWKTPSGRAVPFP